MLSSKLAICEQSPPEGEGVVIGDLVIKDIQSRMEAGKEKYGTYLRAHNRRLALVDMYQELLDAVLYCRQLLTEMGAFDEENEMEEIC